MLLPIPLLMQHAVIFFKSRLQGLGKAQTRGQGFGPQCYVSAKWAWQPTCHDSLGRQGDAVENSCMGSSGFEQEYLPQKSNLKRDL